MKAEIITIRPRIGDPFATEEESQKSYYALEFSNLGLEGIPSDERILLRFDSFEYDLILGDEKALTFLNKVASVIQTEL